MLGIIVLIAWEWFLVTQSRKLHTKNPNIRTDMKESFIEAKRHIVLTSFFYLCFTHFSQAQ